MVGRPRKPIELKLLQGTYDKRRSPTNPPVLPSIAEDPSDPIRNPPAHLSKRAKKEWLRIAPILEKAGLLKIVDRAALEVICQLAAQCEEAVRVLHENGFSKPVFRIYIRSADQLRRYLIEFGMTPASRSRIENPTKEKY